MPDGFRRGDRFQPYDWQIRFLGNFYLVRADAPWIPENPIRAPAFVHRRGMIVAPQKMGKDPITAAQVCLEGAGPALFGGYAGTDEGYVCAEHGCGCGWEYPYDKGEPKGLHWPTPLIQITAVSEEATSNTFDVLRPMIELGPLSDIIPKLGEEFIRLPGAGRIDTVTSSAQSRLGQRITFVTQGEVGIWTRTNGMEKVADTQYRGLAGMGGRASMNTNAWDPSEHSVAQRHYEAAAPDVYVQFDRPPSGLSMKVKDERWRILRHVYPEDVRREKGGHLDLDSVEAESADMVVHDPPQAARFFGNQLVTGSGKAFDSAAWDELADPRVVPPATLISMGFDGSKTGDHTALIACDLVTGYLWTLGIWDPDVHGGEVPRDLVDAAVAEAFATYNVARFYPDPPYWKEEVAGWMGKYGDKVVVPWPTYRNRPMGFAVRSFAQAVADKSIAHDGDAAFARHVGNAQRKPLSERDDKGAPLWTIQKETPDSPKKIDAAVSAVLAWEARNDAIASGALLVTPTRYVTASDLDAYYGTSEARDVQQAPA